MNKTRVVWLVQDPPLVNSTPGKTNPFAISPPATTPKLLNQACNLNVVWEKNYSWGEHSVLASQLYPRSHGCVSKTVEEIICAFANISRTAPPTLRDMYN